MVQNKALVFKKVPSSYPVPGEHLIIESRELDLDTDLPKNAIITKNIYTSFDPYQRGRMRNPESESYSPPYTLGKPLDNSMVATVIKSNSPKFKEGDIIHGRIPTEEYSILTTEDENLNMRVLQNPYNLDLKLFIGALGMPGLTAYSSFYEIGKPQKGETIFISAASGAVGAIVGQLAKHEGLTVIGSVGSDDKLAFITKDLAFDGGFNYKKEKPRDALKRLAPKGIDIYYENVGGEQLEASLDALNNWGRIIACGMISQYNTPPAEMYGIKNAFNFIQKRLTMRGFIVGDPDMGPRWASKMFENLPKWIHEGSFKAQMSVTDGMDNAATGFVGMLKGENFGKAVLKIAELDEKVQSYQAKL